jgi:hypothetical protein
VERGSGIAGLAPYVVRFPNALPRSNSRVAIEGQLYFIHEPRAPVVDYCLLPPAPDL